MTNRFHHEDDIAAAYEAAEFIVMGLIQRGVIMVPDERQPAKRSTIQATARAVADAVIRSANSGEDSDISTLHGVTIERVI